MQNDNIANDKTGAMMRSNNTQFMPLKLMKWLRVLSRMIA